MYKKQFYITDGFDPKESDVAKRGADVRITLEKHFGFSNGNAHRAKSDAENCGRILTELVLIADKSFTAEHEIKERSKPSREELYVCAFIQGIIAKHRDDTSWLRFRKNSGGYRKLSHAVLTLEKGLKMPRN